MNIDEMEPGRELDALMAEKVMGKCGHILRDFRPVGLSHYGPNMCCVRCNKSVTRGEIDDTPHYSTEIADAWAVVDKLRLAIGPDKDNDSMWYCTKLGSNTHGAVGETAPLAICRAALKAIEGEK